MGGRAGSEIFMKNIDIKQVMRYIASGLAGLTANLLGFTLFYQILENHYIFAAIMGFMSGVLVSFVCQKFFTFKNRVVGETGKQFAVHLVLLSFNLVATTLLIIAMVEFFHIPKTLSVIIANGLASVWSFAAYKILVFVPSSHV